MSTHIGGSSDKLLTDLVLIRCPLCEPLYADGATPLEVANYWNNPETAPALRHLMGFQRRIGVKCEGFNMGVQEHYSVQRVGVSEEWRESRERMAEVGSARE